MQKPMSISPHSSEEILKEIDDAFHFIEMPPINEITFHGDDCHECEYLKDDIELFRDKEITGDLIRLIHQDLPHLSAKAWQWILPYYLRFCFTLEAEYNRMETEFLIYSLIPSIDFQSDALKRLSLLQSNQINCVIHFLEWCSAHPHWKEYCPDEICEALNFLRSQISKDVL